MEASVRELKAGLSQYLRVVQRGDSVVVTSRGKAIARIVPLQPSASLDQQLATLPGVDAGTGGKPQPASHPVRIGPGQKAVSEIVMEERR